MENAFDKLMNIITFLEDNRVFYRISKVSEMNDRIMLEIAIPGERWEIEADYAGRVFIEKFISDGSIYDESELNLLIEKNDSDGTGSESN